MNGQTNIKSKRKVIKYVKVEGFPKRTYLYTAGQRHFTRTTYRLPLYMTKPKPPIQPLLKESTKPDSHKNKQTKVSRKVSSNLPGPLIAVIEEIKK